MGVVQDGTLIIGAGDITLNGNILQDLIINSPIISASPINLTAIDDIQINALVQTTGGADISFIADSNNDGLGGIQLTSLGMIDSSGSIFLQGSNYTDLEQFLLVMEKAIDIQNDGANNQLQAVNNITLQGSGLATADLVLDGAINGTDAGTIFFNSDNNITISNNI